MKSIILATNFDFINYHLILQDKNGINYLKMQKLLLWMHIHACFHGSNVYHVLKRMKII